MRTFEMLAAFSLGTLAGALFTTQPWTAPMQEARRAGYAAAVDSVQAAQDTLGTYSYVFPDSLMRPRYFSIRIVMAPIKWSER